MEDALPEGEDEDHHVVPRSRGGSNKAINLTPVEPRIHDGFHNIYGNARPDEILPVLATDTVGYGKNRTIEPRQLDTVYQITTMINWPELYEPGAIVPSGTVESLSKHPRTLFRHATNHQVEALFHLNCALDGLDHGKGFGWQKNRVLQQSCRFFETPDDPLGAMRELLTEEYKGRFTWVDALHEETRLALLGTLNGSELVPLTRGASMELRGVISKQRAYIANHYRQWMAAYEAHYGQGRKKKKRAATSMRGHGGRR